MNLYFEIFNYQDKLFEYYVKYNYDAGSYPMAILHKSHRIWKQTSDVVNYNKNREGVKIKVDLQEFTFIQLRSIAL